MVNYFLIAIVTIFFAILVALFTVLLFYFLKEFFDKRRLLKANPDIYKQIEEERNKLKEVKNAREEVYKEDNKTRFGDGGEPAGKSAGSDSGNRESETTTPTSREDNKQFVDERSTERRRGVSVSDFGFTLRD